MQYLLYKIGFNKQCKVSIIIMTHVFSTYFFSLEFFLVNKAYNFLIKNIEDENSPLK